MILHQIVREIYSLMMCYVIKTKNNKLIVIDGGIDGHGWEADVYLLDVLKEIQKTDKPVIDAWIFTHVHRDHFYEFVKMVNNNKDDFRVLNFYFHFPSRDFIYDYCSLEEKIRYEDFIEAFNEYNGPGAYENYKMLEAGQLINIDDLSFEIMQVPDNTTSVNPVNNSCIVFRLLYDNKKILFLGDLGIESGLRLLKTYGKDLESDIVQMAHHGQNGVTKEVYEMINPKICLWPTPIWVWENRDKEGVEGKGIYQTTLVRKWMYEDIGVKKHYVSCLTGSTKIDLSLLEV